MFTSYEDVLAYLYASVPVFQRVGSSAYKADLTNTLILGGAIDNPQSKFKSIHVAGTNGTGSTSHMLASIFQSSGYKTGLYTSPHLKEFTERIKINGQEVDRHFVVDFVNRIKSTIDDVKPSFFEVTVAMAFDYFAQQSVDVAVVEVGLGGRLDSTNVIVPEVSVITNIGWDHTDLLGDTLEKIAREKAGIIKPGIPAVISERQKEVEGVFMDASVKNNATLHFASDEYTAAWTSGSGDQMLTIKKNDVIYIEGLALPLQGLYQQKNVPGVIKVVDVLNNIGFAINRQALQHGLVNVVRQTGLKGRWQKLGEHPLVICDTGHNVNGIEELIRQINMQKFEKLHMVIGMVKDKDISKVLALLPRNARYYFCEAKIPRALSADLLAEKARDFGLDGIVIHGVNEALRVAKSSATKDDFIFIGGSTFVVAELENL